MKKILMLLGGLGLCLFSRQSHAETITCGKELECFIKAAKTCQEAEVFYTSIGPILPLGGNPTVTSKLKIDGLKRGKCSYSGTVMDAKMELDKSWEMAMQKTMEALGKKEGEKERRQFEKERGKLQERGSLDFQKYTLGMRVSCELPPKVLADHLMAMRDNLYTLTLYGDAEAAKKVKQLPPVQCLATFPKREVNGVQLDQHGGPRDMIDPNTLAVMWFGSR